ncbi:unnamed protein product [Acanthosepion pharaonis]|uniref:Transmembrane protein n=1 Tax=Acanthosepion pharaonis TaxID=158019 RepID=A0A812CTV8_ACAPH|nr:unnamed protein product [Sepia pharaonis]
MPSKRLGSTDCLLATEIVFSGAKCVWGWDYPILAPPQTILSESLSFLSFFFSQKVLRRQATGDKGKNRMMLAALSSKPAYCPFFFPSHLAVYFPPFLSFSPCRVIAHFSFLLNLARDCLFFFSSFLGLCLPLFLFFSLCPVIASFSFHLTLVCERLFVFPSHLNLLCEQKNSLFSFYLLLHFFLLYSRFFLKRNLSHLFSLSSF